MLDKPRLTHAARARIDSLLREYHCSLLAEPVPSRLHELIGGQSA
jgi:hypothetical protein